MKIKVKIKDINTISDLTLYHNNEEKECADKAIKCTEAKLNCTFNCTLSDLDRGNNEIKLVAHMKQGDVPKQSSVNVQQLDRFSEKMLLRVAIIASDKNGKLIDDMDDKYKQIHGALEGLKRFKIVNIDDKKESIVNKYNIKYGITITPDNAQNAAKEANVDMFLLLTINKHDTTTKFVETGCFATETEKDAINCGIPPKETILEPNVYTTKHIGYEKKSNH
ncbi:hypothetical protein MBAV_006124 [Candidatus Magnetobacterium bavaricum]|uniref:Uncharacterized protein n=1 Tax=Candidatus Magnetobacterium bavaricum TaxID=29290 RepID=A0A0F3GLV5_9BACT|nr:hypothetical protein MBAV_006124 [Candidatus Magnetobacterium bavaricum]